MEDPDATNKAPARGEAQGGNDDDQQQQEQEARPRSPLPSQFPDKLMVLLEREAATEALWWLPDVGTIEGAFAINRKAFTAKVLDMAFNGNKWPSITRNLNRWGYRHVSYPDLPPHTAAYHNPNFQPNRPDLLKIMTQNKGLAKAVVKQVGKRRKSSPISNDATVTASIPGRPGAISSPAASPTPEQLLSLPQSSSLVQEGDVLPSPSAGQMPQPEPHAPPPLQPGAATALRRTSLSRPAAETQARSAPNDTKQNPEIMLNSSSSSIGFELFPNQQLQDVLPPNVTANLDTQGMLQSILVRQEGLDAIGLHPMPCSDSALVEQVQHQEALLGSMQQSSPQPQPQLFGLQHQEHQQQHQDVFQPQPQHSQLSHLAFDDSGMLPPTQAMLHQLQQQQQQPPFLEAPSQPQPHQPTSAGMRQQLLNMHVLGYNHPMGRVDSIGTDTHEVISSQLQQQEILINELVRQQTQLLVQNPHSPPHGPPNGQGDRKSPS